MMINMIYWMARRAALLAIMCVYVTGCGSRLPVTEPLEIAEVGHPLIFDGRRLLQEYSERRIEIDKIISSASIQDIETSARIASSSSLQLGASVGLLTEPTAIEAYRESQLANAQSNRNQIALQNLLVENTENQYALADQQANQYLENGKQQTDLQSLRLSNYRTLIAHYTSVLSTTPNTEKNKAIRDDAVAQLSTIRTEMATQSLTTETISAPTDVSVNRVAADTKLSELVAAPSAGTSIENPTVTENASALDKLSERLAKVVSQPSTRIEQFQQYQSYIDELYGTRNQYLLDDSNSREGRRLIRLVIPVYVPPSKSNETRTIRFTLGNNPNIKNSKEESDNAHNLKITAKLQALNLLSQRRNDNNDLNRSQMEAQVMSTAALVFTGMQTELCESSKKVCACNSLEQFGRKISAFDKSESIVKIKFSIDDAELSTKSQARSKYDRLVQNCSRGIGAASLVGISDVGTCLAYNPMEPRWSVTDSSCPKPKIRANESEVYAIRPRVDREKIEQESSRLFGIGVALGESFGSSKVLGAASLSAQYTKEQFIQAAARVPVVAAYTGVNSSHDMKEFGWHIYPRITLSKSNKPIRRHMGTHLSGTVDLSIPDTWKEATLSVYYDDSNNVKYSYPIQIPKLSSQEYMSRAFTQPVVTQFNEYGVVDVGTQISISIAGINLWRSPEVLIGGRRADDIGYVSGNPNHLTATFKNLKGVSCNYNRENYAEEKSRYWGKTINSGELCGSKIMVHTTDGRAFAGSLLTKKTAKAKKTENTEKPTAKFHSARIKDNTLTLVLREPIKTTYADGAAAEITQTVLAAPANVGFLKLIKQSTIEAKPTLKLVHFAGDVSDLFCRSGDNKFLSECLVTLKIGKVVKFNGSIRVQK